MLCPYNTTVGFLVGVQSLVHLGNVYNDNDMNVLVSLSVTPGVQPEAIMTKGTNTP